MPASPSWRYRCAQRFAVGHAHWKRSAARAIVHPSSTTRRASFRRAFGVRAALAWDTRTSWVAGRSGSSSTPRQEVLTCPITQTVSSHLLNQRAWSVHLVLEEGENFSQEPTRCLLGELSPRRWCTTASSTGVS